MGHRANYVVIEKGKATAYQDQWGALGCTFLLGDGPADARTFAKATPPTTKLLTWTWAEAGFLLDFPAKHCIAFGMPEYDASELPDDVRDRLDEFMGKLRAGPAALFRHVGSLWKGWTLVWDERGVDAFADYLEEARLTTIKTQKRTSDARTLPPRIAVTIPAKKKAAAKKPAAKKKTAAKKPAAKKKR